MARQTPDRNLGTVIDAAQEWVHRCLIRDDAILSNEQLWTAENINEVRRAFVDNPDDGAGNFLTKLQGQMGLTSSQAKRLMAEIVWALLLFPSKIDPPTKRQQVAEIWAMSGDTMPSTSPFLADDVLAGVGSAGTAYHAQRWREVGFLVTLVEDLKKKPQAERQTILSEYDAFTKWLGNLPRGGDRQFRHMLRFFCFPDRVERMSSNRAKRDVLAGFDVAPAKELRDWSDKELDEAMFELRQRLEKEYPGQVLDFYAFPLHERWKKTAPLKEEDSDEAPLEDAFEGHSIDTLLGSFGGACSETLVLAKSLALRLTSSLLSKRLLIATGLAGSGKTKLAQAFARWMSPMEEVPDVFVPGARIPSAQITYFVGKSDDLSIEFWNSADEVTAKKVVLAREMIDEWANYIQKNSVHETIPAREIREAVKAGSKFSDQLHSFETHLKAAAFALLKQRSGRVPARCCALVPVGADWTGNEDILGYPDGLQSTRYVAKPALELILHASNHSEVPHFLILDEMNLSHVERYFADILSMIESDEGLDLYSGDMVKPETWRQTAAAIPVPPKLKQLPKNLFIIGTVNVDETTYMFSPKVLDRANVIEFRMDAGELESFLVNPAKPDLSKLDGKGQPFGRAFVEAAISQVAVPTEAKATYDAEMLLFFKTLQSHGAEFGYRTAYETARFIHFYKVLGNHPDNGAWFSGAFDCVVFQKLLPKLHGSRAKLGPVLKKLWFLCVNGTTGRGLDALQAAEEAARSTDKMAEPSVAIPNGAPYPLSAEKIGRMWRLLMENGFASFAEA